MSKAPSFVELFTPKLVTVLKEGYGTKEFRADALAGVTVAIVALPLSMAIAIASGLGPERGLYAAILESGFASMTARLKAMEEGAPTARAALRAFLDAFAQVTRDEPGFPTLFLREVLAKGLEPAVVPYLVEIIGVSRRLKR